LLNETLPFLQNSNGKIMFFCMVLGKK